MMGRRFIVTTPARSRAARTRRSARRYALPAALPERKNLSQSSHSVGRARPSQAAGPHHFLRRIGRRAQSRRRWPPKKIVTPTAALRSPASRRSLTRSRPPDAIPLSFKTTGDDHADDHEHRRRRQHAAYFAAVASAERRACTATSTSMSSRTMSWDPRHRRGRLWRARTDVDRPDRLHRAGRHHRRILNDRGGAAASPFFCWERNGHGGIEPP
jgi:hypothetical protein